MIIQINATDKMIFKIWKSNYFLNLYTATKSAKIKIGKVIANASPNGITIVINGIETNATDPPRPAFEIPNSKIAGTTVTK